MEPELIVDLGSTALRALRARLDERMEEASDG
jgi:hypothetical protein